MDQHLPHHDQRPIVATAIEAPWGPIHIAATDDGVVAVELLATASAFGTSVERRLGRGLTWMDDPRCAPGSGSSHRHLLRTVDGLSRALDGDDSGLADLPLDLADRPAWDQMVLAAVRAIPRGETRGYGEVAQAIGRPGAARAVGGAVGRNPIGYIIPCHRVIAGDGTLGGYGGGWWGDHERLLELKADLLRREGHALRQSPARGDRGR